MADEEEVARALISDSKSYLISTSDNPWSPWTHFTEWNAWDMMAGYHTLAYLARVTATSNELSEANQEHDYMLAVEEILRLNITGTYIKVPEPDGDHS